MPEMTVKVTGFDKLLAKLDRIPKASEGKVRDQVKRSTINVQREARRNAPVDTGRLRSSIRFKVSDEGFTGQVFSDVEYAAFVEFGTSRIGSRPFLVPAWEDERKVFIEAIARIIRNTIK